MRSPYFTSEHIYLRAVEPEDLDALYVMENDSQVWNITNSTVPYSRYVLKRYIETSQYDLFADRQLRLMIVRQGDDIVVGTIDITDFIPIHARGEVGIAIRKDFQGCGYAQEALTLLCNYAFNCLLLKQLVSHVVVDNIPSLQLFTSCGFVQCGLLKSWWIVDGVPQDVVLLQRLHPKEF